MRDIMGMMKQVQEMQARMQAVQAELADMDVAGESGGGLVRVTMSGKADIKAIKIDPSLAKPDETEILEDLLMAAVADAKAKAEAATQEKMQDVTGGLPIPPGLKLW
ncbi:MAG: YbaB/EbfC family nucleoid-associated protein [Pseudomonadota bacterium]